MAGIGVEGTAVWGNAVAGGNAVIWDNAAVLEGTARQVLEEVATRAAAAVALVEEGLVELASLDALVWESPAGEAFRDRAGWLRAQLHALVLLIEQAGVAARAAAAALEAPSAVSGEVGQAALGALRGLLSAGLPLLSGG